MLDDLPKALVHGQFQSRASGHWAGQREILHKILKLSRYEQKRGHGIQEENNIVDRRDRLPSIANLLVPSN